jgi:ferredoxin
MWIMCQTCQRACPVGKEQRSKRIGRGTGPVDERV